MQIIINVTLIYIFLIIGLRILGKREFGQLSPLELVTLLLIPEILSTSLHGDDYSLINGLTGVATLLLLTLAASSLMYKSKKAASVMSGDPTVLIHRGRFLQQNMNRERVDGDELYTEMHKVGLTRLEEVRWAILERDGKISIIPEKSNADQANGDNRAYGLVVQKDELAA
jgi:uncharacterized membrane protein YcaP (DUF421 family)